MHIDHTLFDFQWLGFFVVLDFGGEVLGETMRKFVHMWNYEMINKRIFLFNLDNKQELFLYALLLQ